jgi:hypothetical protein
MIILYPLIIVVLSFVIGLSIFIYRINKREQNDK